MDLPATVFYRKTLDFNREKNITYMSEYCFIFSKIQFKKLIQMEYIMYVWVKLILNNKYKRKAFVVYKMVPCAAYFFMRYQIRKILRKQLQNV